MKDALFIDDETDFIYIIERLQKAGKIPNLGKLYSAPNGRAALEFLKQQPVTDLPNAMFIDINMPVMNGHEFLAEFSRLRQETKAFAEILPIAVLTTSSSPLDREKIKAYDFVQKYLIKDVELTALAETINELL